MKVEYFTNGWRAIAEDGRAICKVGESGPTTITRVSGPASASAAEWVDCDYGEPRPSEPVTDDDLIAALRRLGVEV